MRKGNFPGFQLLLIGMTTVFLLTLGVESRREQERLSASPVVVETQFQASASEIAPVDISRIDLNTASVERLTELPGIGEALARRIVEYRQQMGPFQSIEDVMNVKGIGEKKFSKFQDQITVGKDVP